MDENRGIGKENRVPWHLPADLRRFKRLTMGHHILMGRKTFESIGRALPGRTMVILSRRADYTPENCPPDRCFVVDSLQAGLELARQAGDQEAFVIGGTEVYRQALPLAGRIYLTIVHTTLDCDTFFPRIDEVNWKVVNSSRQPSDESHPYASTLRILERTEG